MKKSVNVLSFLVIILIGFAVTGPAVMAQATIAMTQDLSSTPDIQIGVVSTHLPRENPSAPVTQSSTWMAAAQNWNSVNFDGTFVAGSGFNKAERFTAIDYTKMVTSTAFQSWDAALHNIPGNNQFGQRLHTAVQISAMRPGVTFKMREITISIKSYIYDTLANQWRLDGVIVAFTTLESLNYFRVRCDSAGAAGFQGDLVSLIQDSSISSTSCYFGGIGIGVGAYGSGTDAQKLQNVINYMVNNHFVVGISVAVPYDDNGVGKTAYAENVLVPAQLQMATTGVDAPKLSLPFGFKPGTTDVLRLGNTTGTPVASSGTLYMLQKSRDMDSWTGANSVARFGTFEIIDFPIEDMMRGETHYFYRAITICFPTTRTALFAENLGKNLSSKQAPLPEGLPVGDVTLL